MFHLIPHIKSAYQIRSYVRMDIKKRNIENTSWKVLAYGIYSRVADVSEVERVSAANE